MPAAVAKLHACLLLYYKKSRVTSSRADEEKTMDVEILYPSHPAFAVVNVPKEVPEVDVWSPDISISWFSPQLIGFSR